MKGTAATNGVLRTGMKHAAVMPQPLVETRAHMKETYKLGVIMNKGATIVDTRSLDGRIMKGGTIELGTTTKLGRITMNVGTMELGTTTKLGRHLYTKDWR